MLGRSGLGDDSTAPASAHRAHRHLGPSKDGTSRPSASMNWSIGWEADHIYKLDAKAIEAFLLLMFLAYNILHASSNPNCCRVVSGEILGSVSDPPSIFCPLLSNYFLLTAHCPPQLSASPARLHPAATLPKRPIRACSDRPTPSNSFRCRCLAPSHNLGCGIAAWLRLRYLLRLRFGTIAGGESRMPQMQKQRRAAVSCARNC